MENTTEYHIFKKRKFSFSFKICSGQHGRKSIVISGFEASGILTFNPTVVGAFHLNSTGPLGTRIYFLTKLKYVAL